MNYLAEMDPRKRFTGEAPGIHTLLKRVYGAGKIELENSVDLPEYLEANNYFTFSFVRHPFDRLASAYINKLEQVLLPSSEKKIVQIGVAARQVYQATHGNVTFPNFLDYVVKEGEKSAQALDSHWFPYYTKCNYCSMNYSFIGRMETFDEDLK